MNLEILTAATDTAIPLVIAKNHLRIDGIEDDANIAASVKAAAAYVINLLGRSIITVSYELTLDSFAAKIYLPNPPLISIDSVKYDDSEGNEQTLAATEYEAGYENGLAYMQATPNAAWPELDSTKALQRVRVAYTAGYGEQESVPEDIRQAMLLLIGDYYENREAQFVGVTPSVNQTVDRLLTTHRLTMGV
jgi:uncharacterized phiE125 gp8 family phage protein